ncbi:MAG: hypothetical protein KIT62_04435 [Cyclobacteriaceae bacterium]|nr:hypothetical protein [Cyclobacteriaceae bacterium]
MFCRIYRIINLLNVDVAIGAMISSLYFARLMQAPVRVYGVAALGLTVWIIYTADRLLDVRHLTKPASSERHRFHQLHAGLLWVLVLITSVTVCVLVIFIRPTVLLGGIMLAPVIALYLLFQKKLPVKEFMVALLYTTGVLLPAWPGSWQPVWQVAGLIGQFFLVALTNIFLFAWFEAEADTRMGQLSIVTRIGKKRVFAVIMVLLALGVTATAIAMVLNYLAGAIFLSMWFVLVALLRFSRYFEKHERYRLWGDAIFYLPVLGLL